MAGSLKCTYRGKLSLEDAYILAAARILKGILFTTDPRLKELNIVQTNLLEVT
ncbi:MAG: hypothetical protein RMJ15_06490 [Nitrososphaerota archaeon]|nr:hypothetical protein [Candidatus Bathyarchaeota archaeon]MDW8023367.1 hypothetical protein [Nitrososphaerota archaeon]